VLFIRKPVVDDYLQHIISRHQIAAEPDAAAWSFEFVATGAIELRSENLLVKINVLRNDSVGAITRNCRSTGAFAHFAAQLLIG